MSHLRAADGSVLCEHAEPHPVQLLQPVARDDGEHEHTPGLVDRSILRSRAGIRDVAWSLAVLTVTALAQAFIYSRTLSALLADLIHNFGDALTAIPLGLAFFLRSPRGERLAGLAVVLAILISALVALGQTIERFLHPRSLSHLWLLAAAGIIGSILCPRRTPALAEQLLLWAPDDRLGTLAPTAWPAEGRGRAAPLRVWTRLPVALAHSAAACSPGQALVPPPPPNRRRPARARRRPRNRQGRRPLAPRTAARNGRSRRQPARDRSRPANQRAR